MNSKITDTEGAFALVDSGGNTISNGTQLGLLLYRGGTVCDDSFNDIAAKAICKDMNFTHALKWNSYTNFDIQSNYEIKLDDVECSSGEWKRCRATEVYSHQHHDCEHNEDVLLSCGGEQKDLQQHIFTGNYEVRNFGERISNFNQSETRKHCVLGSDWLHETLPRKYGNTVLYH